jgi:hypothetical protein
MSTKKLFIANGINDQPSKLKKNVRIGENTKLKVLAFVGTTVSFSSSFKPSTNGCNKPKKPT